MLASENLAKPPASNEFMNRLVAAIIESHNSGVSSEAIARRFNVSSVTVRRLRAKHAKGALRYERERNAS